MLYGLVKYIYTPHEEGEDNISYPKCEKKPSLTKVQEILQIHMPMW